MEFFQYKNPSIVIRGNYDNVDFWNMVERVFKSKGYTLVKSYNSFIGDLAGCEYKSKSGNLFTFEYDDWGTLELYPDDPSNENLLDELHLLANEIEQIGSNNPDKFYQDSHVNKKTYPQRRRIVYKT